MNLKKCILIVFTMLVLVSCSSKNLTVAEMHAKSADQWFALSEFSGNEFKQFGYTLVGSLLIDEKDTDVSFKLVDIHIAKQSSASQIDLLSLNFDGKFACSDKCYQLNQMFMGDGNNRTLLSHITSENEPELFEFYSFLFQVNKQISQYMLHIPDEFDKYIDWIAGERVRGSSLKSFSKYLDDKFSKQSVVNFLSFGHSDKAFQIISEVNDLPIRPSQQSGDIEFIAPETKDWMLSSSEHLTGDQVIVRNIIDSKEAQLKYNVEKLTSFELLKSFPIRVGDVVCSFSDNKIGTVIDLDLPGQIMIKTIGEGVILLDGIMHKAAPGYFYQKGEPIYLSQKTLEITYSSDKVTRCEFEGINELVE